MTKALITGITGQDGHHLTKLLLEKGYQVYGLVNGQRNSREESFAQLFPEAQLFRGDLTDFSSLISILRKIQPDEIYNLGAISFVGLSFKQPEMTANITGLGFLRLLEAVRQSGFEDKTKIYQASSSEMYGKVREVPQNELTPFHPRSPYGVAKTFAHYTAVNYREAYGMHVSSGILFNHEGEYRGHEFVTRKISHHVAMIKCGLIQDFSLGDLSPKRDWGYAGDYVIAMHAMLQNPLGDDFVIATGETHSVREFVQLALDIAELRDPLETYVKFDQEMLRPSEVDLLVGDPGKASRELGWRAMTSFEYLVRIMVENDLNLVKKSN
jgi:GDPmannose 4,6-dehydratase